MKLVESGGELVSRKELFESVWPDVEVKDANLTNNVTLLRKVLGADAVQTVSKYGYRFCLPVTYIETLSQRAEESFREGQDQMVRRTAASVERARNLFWLVLADHPEYAPAWAWLARASRFLEKFGVDREYHRSLSERAIERAFNLQPDLGIAYQLSINMQVDRGEAIHALPKLLERVRKDREDASAYAALVQVCRFCGLLNASKAAHHRAKELNPAVETSLPHTYFADCDFQAVVEVYAADAKGSPGFLDLSAWAALGFAASTEREVTRRLERTPILPVFEALLKSLLLVLQGKAKEAEEFCTSVEVYQDPESALYFARHLAFCGSEKLALAFLRRTLEGGLAVPVLLERDPWLAKVRDNRDFAGLLDRARDLRRKGEECLETTRAADLLEPAV